jgi:hypothetical protein
MRISRLLFEVFHAPRAPQRLDLRLRELCSVAQDGKTRAQRSIVEPPFRRRRTRCGQHLPALTSAPYVERWNRRAAERREIHALNAVTRTQKAQAANYPFCTIDPNVGVVTVPDPRLDVLAKLSGSQKIIPAAIEFVDIAGLVKGASAGEGLGISS